MVIYTQPVTLPSNNESMEYRSKLIYTVVAHALLYEVQYVFFY